ncbi:MAG: hypothetical protein J6B77_00120 [Clostridia bacterium]|nr:hypothetical protein [Clostridia bacterium]
MNTFMEAFASVFESVLSLDFMLFFEVLAAAFQCLLCVDFILKFNEKTWQSSRFAFSALMVLSLWSVFSGRFLSDYRGVCVLVLIVLSVAFALTVCGRQYVQAIFSSSIFYVMALIAESLANALLSVFRSESLPPDDAAVDFTRVLYLVFTSVLL